METFYVLRLNGKNPTIYPPNAILQSEDKMELIDRILLEVVKIEPRDTRELYLVNYSKDKNRLIFYDLVTPYGEDENREEIVLNGCYYAVGDRLKIVDL